MPFTTYEEAIDALLTPSDRERGWGPRFLPLRDAALGLPGPTSVAELDARGLHQQWVCGYITVDFGARTLTFCEANLRDGYDEHVFHPTPGEAWWTAARTLVWPLRDTPG